MYMAVYQILHYSTIFYDINIIKYCTITNLFYNIYVINDIV